MTLRQELLLVSTENLEALLASLGADDTFERETIIRILNERTPPSPARPNPVKQGLLDAQMEWIDSL